MDPDPDSDPDPAIFVIDLQDANKKLIFCKTFFCILLFECKFTSFFRDKSQEESQNSRNQWIRIRDPDPQHWYSPSGSVLSFLLGGVRAGDISSLQSMLLVVVLVLLLLPSEQRKTSLIYCQCQISEAYRKTPLVRQWTLTSTPFFRRDLSRDKSCRHNIKE
jgi:hypothetical protein